MTKLGSLVAIGVTLVATLSHAQTTATPEKTTKNDPPKVEKAQREPV
jgi:hypothetical protein